MVWLEAIMQTAAGSIQVPILKITGVISARTLWQTQWHSGKELIRETSDLKWDLFKNVFTLNVDLFDEYRDKMLLAPKSITILIGQGLKELNLGKVKKHGIEIEAEFRKSVTPDFQYFVRGIFGFNENRVIFKDDPPGFPDYMKLAGKPLTEMLKFGVRC